MTDQEALNVEVIRRQHDLLAAGDEAAVVAQWCDPAENHGRPAPHAVLAAIFGDIRTTFPDFSLAIDEAVACGDTVVARCRFRGTHRGVGRLPVNGGLLIGVEPTGKSFDVQHIHWYVLRDGLFAAHWANRDDVGMMQQLGLLPQPNFDFSKLRQ